MNYDIIFESMTIEEINFNKLCSVRGRKEDDCNCSGGRKDGQEEKKNKGDIARRWNPPLFIFCGDSGGCIDIGCGDPSF